MRVTWSQENTVSWRVMRMIKTIAVRSGKVTEGQGVSPRVGA